MSVLTNCFTIAENHECKSWKSVLGEIQLAINCTVSKSTGKSPLQLLMGCNKSPPRINALVHNTKNLISLMLERRLRSEWTSKHALTKSDLTRAKQGCVRSLSLTLYWLKGTPE